MKMTLMKKLKKKNQSGKRKGTDHMVDPSLNQRIKVDRTHMAEGRV
jgi:hypothetical protein